MKIQGSTTARLTMLEQMAQSPLSRNVGGPVAANLRRIRIAKTAAMGEDPYPPEGSTAFPIIFLDASFTPVDETAVATYEERTDEPEEWAYSVGYLPEGATVIVLRDNDLYVDDTGSWFVISGCDVDQIRILTTDDFAGQYEWGEYYHLACEGPDVWHLVELRTLGDCSGSSSGSGGGGSCDWESYDPGLGWTTDGPDGSYDASFSNGFATSPPADPPSGSWTFVGGEPYPQVWVAFDCNGIAYGAMAPP